MQRTPFVTDQLLKRCRKELSLEHQRSGHHFDHVALDDRKELSMLVEDAIRHGESYSTIAERHSEIGLTEGELRELIGPESAIRDRIERFHYA
ncbi:hypothetical protein [Larsenimonas rhizosphaerae]|uniref:Uncharacterized protein n=1 Tax=Larsenimonas rhizosphaerae TaxID=2944682 RepID=A0AA42CWL6_9GAMM|nr:hypothetical protein [Larsenimonas rhizosphaerae]MCM2130071.1 hypothetical protein [Larsenimonas rhizosphaerae]MCX2522758.1 hypothetical protein [Larsenimonas rhizosphaerae]